MERSEQLLSRCWAVTERLNFWKEWFSTWSLLKYEQNQATVKYSQPQVHGHQDRNQKFTVVQATSDHDGMPQFEENCWEENFRTLKFDF